MLTGDYGSSFALQSGMGLLLICSFLGWLLYKKAHWSVGTAYIYFSFNAIPRMTFPQVVYSSFQFDVPELIGMQSAVIEAHLFLTLIAIVFAFINLRNTKTFFLALGMIDVFVMLYKIIIHFGEQTTLATDPWFLFNNAAFDCAFVACMLPFFLEYTRCLKKPIRIALLMPVVIVLLASKTSTGVLGLGLALAAYGISANRFKRDVIFAAAGSAGVVALIGYLIQGDMLFVSSGRAYIWQLAMGFWEKSLNHWFGVGAGTFPMLGTAIEIADSLQHGVGDTTLTAFPWLHNDWLQVLFETGIIGLVLAGIIFFIALWRSRNAPAYFASLVTYGAIAVIQMPLRHILFASFGAFLLAHSFRSDQQLEPIV